MIVDDFDSLFDVDVFGEIVDFIPALGPPQKIVMIVDTPYLDISNQIGSNDYVLSAPVSSFITTPKKGDRFESRGKILALIAPAATDKTGKIYTLECNIW